MKGHVLWCPVFVRVSDVMDCTDSHRNLPNCIDNGQVDDSPVRGKGKEIAVVKDKLRSFTLNKSTNTAM